MHGETNGRTLQGACHLVRGLPWPRLDCGLQAIRRLVKLFGRCARKCSRSLNLASSSLHDLTCVRFVAFSILCLTLRYISEYSSSSNLVKPAIYRSILRWVLASFSTSAAVNGADDKPYNAVGVTMLSNNRSLRARSTCLSVSTWRKE